jgi:hypothetical protein
LSRIAEETRRLNEATQSLKTTTEGLVQATEKVHREVGLLADSSKKMEKLTLTLKRFTVWLIIFALSKSLLLRYRLGRCFTPKFATRLSRWTNTAPMWRVARCVSPSYLVCSSGGSSFGASLTFLRSLRSSATNLVNLSNSSFDSSVGIVSCHRGAEISSIFPSCLLIM